MILYTAFTMFVDFTKWKRGYIEGQLVINTSRVPDLILFKLVPDQPPKSICIPFRYEYRSRLYKVSKLDCRP